MNRKLFSILFVLVLIITTLVPCYGTQEQPQAEAGNSEKRIVKVGWFDSEGVHPKVVDGVRKGFDYEYLQAISQYSNWEYEYYDGTWEDCFNKLANGELDLIGVINKTEERELLFDYSYISIGNELCCLFVLPDNMTYAYQDCKNFSGMSVAIEKGTYQGTILKEYAQDNHFTYTTKEYPNLDIACEAVRAGEADAVLASNTDIISGFKAIAQFNPVPFYYATTKGNAEVLEELNNALSELYTYFPNFGNELYNKYYGNSESKYVVFTDEELEYIRSNPVITLAYDSIWYPIEYDDNGKCGGIVADIIRQIEEKSGLSITYGGGNSVDVLRDFQDGKENSITSISYNYDWAAKNNVNITQPFLDASIMRVSKKVGNSAETVALVEVDYITEMVKENFPLLEPIYYSSMAQCIDAVYEGEADCVYMNNYEAEYYMTNPKYQMMNFHTTDAFRQKVCLGVSIDADPRLFSIVSKCLKAIPDSEMEAIVYNNSYHTPSVSLETFIRANPMMTIGILLAFIICIIAVAALFTYNRLQNSRRMSVENERYNQLAEMIGEHIYEYNYQKDLLTFKNPLSDFFEGAAEIENFTQAVIEYHRSNYIRDEDTLFDCFAEKSDSVKDLNLKKDDGSYSHYRATTKIIRDSMGQPVYAIGKLQDIQDSYEEKQQLLDKSMRDAATGLYNSMTFKKLAAESFHYNGGVLFAMDIDHFKSINDNYGHLTGDKTIQAVAKVLKESTDTFNAINPMPLSFTGIVGRVGGDEFDIFLPGNIAKAAVVEFCEAIHKGVASISDKESEFIPPITVSIGATFALTSEEFTECYKRADQVLYVVKDRGRNGYEIL